MTCIMAVLWALCLKWYSHTKSASSLNLIILTEFLNETNANKQL